MLRLSVMDPADRVKLARLSYIRAVALARVSPSPASWARLLMAARNLNEAVREQGQHPGTTRDQPSGA